MSRKLSLLCVVAVGLAIGCSTQPNVEKLPAGTEVQVTRQDGVVVRGQLSRADRDTVVMRVGERDREVRRSDIADVRVIDPAKRDAPLPAVARFREYIVPEGTELSGVLETAVASDVNHAGDPVEARLTEAVAVNGVEVLPAGSVLKGAVSEVQPSGKVKGRASLALQFTSVEVRGVGTPYPMSASMSRVAPATKGEDAKKIGIPAAGGAIIGGLIGGKKGAGIGALVGGGAGTAVVLTTAGEEIRLARGTTFGVRLRQPIEARVPIQR